MFVDMLERLGQREKDLLMFRMRSIVKCQIALMFDRGMTMQNIHSIMVEILEERAKPINTIEELEEEIG